MLRKRDNKRLSKLPVNIYDEQPTEIAEEIVNPMDLGIREACSQQFTDFTKDVSETNQYKPSQLQKQ
jgi:hypothetical protein